MKTNLASPLACTVALASLFLTVVSASGQFMLSPIAVLGTDLGTFSTDSPLVNMINHSGLDKPFVSGTTEFDSYFADPSTTYGNANYTNNWQSDYVDVPPPLMGHVDFDLGATYSLNALAIWNISLSNVTVRISDTTNGLAAGQVAGNFILVNHLQYSYSYDVDILRFATNFQGRYVRLSINSTYTYAPPYNTFAYAIIGEVVASALPVTTSTTVGIARDPNGDLRVTFTGTLQSATNVAGTFNDVPGNPQDSYVIPATSQLQQQYFRAKGN